MEEDQIKKLEKKSIQYSNLNKKFLVLNEKFNESEILRK